MYSYNLIVYVEPNIIPYQCSVLQYFKKKLLKNKFYSLKTSDILNRISN